MGEWIENRLGRIEYAFSEFPILKWRSLFFTVLLFLSVILYQPLIVFLYKFNIMGMQVFQKLIENNIDWLIWGNVILPLAVGLWGYFDVVSLYEEKHLKRYKCLPKWAN